MAQEFSFDVVSDFDHQELVNAIDQARREIGTRYDFKNLTAEIELEKEQLILTTEGDMQLRAMTDVIKSKFHKRHLDLKILDPQQPEAAAKGRLRQVIKLRSVYELLEEVTDTCEDVANIIEGIVLERS